MQKARMHNMDWIRVIAFDLLIIYHIGMIFVPWNYHIKNNEISESFILPMMFLNQWRLPLLFIISGMGTRYALSYKSTGLFIRERILRLFIPLLLGILIIVPPQVYLERLNQSVHYGSYFDFYKTLFQGIYPQGNLSWHHLWFIVYLLFFTLLLTPVFVYVRNNPENKIINKLQCAIEKYPLTIYSLTIPLIFIEVWLYPKFGYTLAFWGDWYALAFYMILFFYGYVFVSMKATFWKLTEHKRFVFLGFAVVFAILYFILPVTSIPIPKPILRIINLWSWILTLLGFSVKYLNKPSNLLSYRNEAVYPFYILHQTVLLALAFYIVKWNVSIATKFILLLISTYGITWLIYEFIIRKNNCMRLIFGIKLINTKKIA